MKIIRKDIQKKICTIFLLIILCNCIFSKAVLANEIALSTKQLTDYVKVLLSQESEDIVCNYIKDGEYIQIRAENQEFQLKNKTKNGNVEISCIKTFSNNMTEDEYKVGSLSIVLPIYGVLGYVSFYGGGEYAQNMIAISITEILANMFDGSSNVSAKEYIQNNLQSSSYISDGIECQIEKANINENDLTVKTTISFNAEEMYNKVQNIGYDDFFSSQYNATITLTVGQSVIFGGTELTGFQQSGQSVEGAFYQNKTIKLTALREGTTIVTIESQDEKLYQFQLIVISSNSSSETTDYYFDISQNTLSSVLSDSSLNKSNKMETSKEDTNIYITVDDGKPGLNNNNDIYSNNQRNTEDIPKTGFKENVIYFLFAFCLVMMAISSYRLYNLRDL